MNKLLEDIRTFFPDFEVTIKDLQTPSPIFVRDFYIRALLEFDVDDENVRKIQLSQNTVDPEEIEIIPELNIVTAVRSAFSFNDIGLLDILAPNQKRTCHHIRNIINFLLFADTRVSALNPHLEAYQTVKEQIEDVKKEKDACSQELNDLALKSNDTLKMKKALELSLDDVKKKFEVINQEIEELTSRKKLLIESLNKKKLHQLSGLQELEMKDRQIEELKREIVEHPEIDQNILLEKESHLEKLREKKHELKTKLKEKKTQKLQLKTSLEAVNNKLLPLCTSVVDEIKKASGLEEDMANQEKELKNISCANEILNNKRKGLQENLAKVEKSKDKFVEEYQKAEEQIRQTIEDGESKYSEKFHKFKAAKKESSQAKKKLDEANKRIENAKREAIEAKKMFEQINDFVSKKEKEDEEHISDACIEIKNRRNKKEQIKKDIQKLNQ